MLFIADNLLQRTNLSGPAGVRYREVLLYVICDMLILWTNSWKNISNLFRAYIFDKIFHVFDYVSLILQAKTKYLSQCFWWRRHHHSVTPSSLATLFHRCLRVFLEGCARIHKHMMTPTKQSFSVWQRMLDELVETWCCHCVELFFIRITNFI